MKIFRRLKIWKELKRLESKVHETPSPSTFVDLGQVYINMDMMDHTIRVADEGLALFPTSGELRKLRKFAKKSQVNRLIKELRARLNKGPNPKLYRDLAELYLEQGDYGAVYGIAEECIRRFPDDPRAYLVLATARLTNFYRDISARDGLEAVRNLLRVIELDPDNVKAQRLVAEVLSRIGATDRSIDHLEKLLVLTPGDREAEALLRDVRQGQNVTGGLEALFHGVESKGRLVNAMIKKAPVSPQRVATEEAIGTIRDSLAHLVEVEGVIKACYIKGSKAMVKGEIRDGKDGFLRVVRVVAKAAQRVSRRMDIGNFSKAAIDGDFGHVCVCSFGDVVAAVQCEFGTPVERILADLQELVAGSLYITGRAKK